MTSLAWGRAGVALAAAALPAAALAQTAAGDPAVKLQPVVVRR